MEEYARLKTVAIVPCYRVSKYVEAVLRSLPGEVYHTIVVDDACPEHSGALVESLGLDNVSVAYHSENKGVGAAVCTGYVLALDMGADIVVKLDGDGQMDALLIGALVAPIAAGQADYVKGNRFASLIYVRRMPLVRRIGNLGLSFITKFSTGYYDLMDPTNGFTAISAKVIPHLELEKISSRYFFESDMLYRLSLLRAVVRDYPMLPYYPEGGVSSLSPSRTVLPFAWAHVKRFIKRIFYNFFYRDFTIGSLHLIVGVICLGFGITFGLIKWLVSIETHAPATAGTVMLSALPIIIGFQSLLSAIQFDVSQIPRNPITPSLHTVRKPKQTAKSM